MSIDTRQVFDPYLLDARRQAVRYRKALEQIAAGISSDGATTIAREALQDSAKPFTHDRNETSSLVKP